VKVYFRGKQDNSYIHEGLQVREMAIMGYPPFNLPIFRRRLEKMLAEEEKVDIVHLHSSVMPTISCGSPTVVTGHCCNNEFIPTCYRPIRGLDELYRNVTLPLYGMIEGNLSRSCTKMTVVSEALREQYEKHYGVSSAVIYNGVDLEMFSGNHILQKENAVLFTGRLSLGKGLPDLLDIAELLKESHPDAIIYVIGSGPLSKELNRKKATRKITNLNIIPHLPHAQLIEYYQRVKVYLLPTLYEGFANSILEAMASALPIVASDISSIREQIESGVDGYLVPPGHIQAFHDRIAEFLDDEEKSTRFGNAGRKKVSERFTWRHVGDLVETQYKELYKN